MGEWYRTGDVGEWITPSTLRVLGRLSEAVPVGESLLFPGAVEAALECSPLIAQAFVFLSASSTVTAVIVPSSLGACQWPLSGAVRGHVMFCVPYVYAPAAGPTLAQAAAEAAVLAAVNEAGLGRECVPAAVVLDPVPWTVTNGYLNGSLKKCRDKLAARYGK